ncbi:transcription elongation factor SPT5 [Cryptococcus depauperatus CBS 7841]|uniref:Transcription elongation factor SPT5 n=1 Tax=Cryptococcus depauperatus CBS 7841 TaxID=1295531 RepID=A0AAJ8JWH8_9TREE
MSDTEIKASPPGSPEPIDSIVGKKRPRAVDPDDEDEDGVEYYNANEEVQETKDDMDAEGEPNERTIGEEEEEDDEEDDEEEEDDEDGERGRKKRRKQNKFRFLDLEVEVDDEDEEEDEDNDFGDGRDEEEDVHDIVRKLKERHAGAARYNGDSDAVPQRLLMPGVNDPSLWKVVVKSGREHAICASIFRKVFSQQSSANPIDVISVFCRDSIPGMIFIEARQSAAVSAAINGIVGIFLSKGVSLVPIEEMAPLLKMKKKDVNLAPGMWVRIKRGKYAGDLAQVVDVDQITSGVVGIKFLPRIDLTPREKRKERNTAGKPTGVRPPARLFSYDEVRKIYGRQSVRQGVQGAYLFENDEYVDGFCIKDVKIPTLATEDINPTLEEISKFTGDDESAAKFDLSAIADANKNLSSSLLFPGDKVEVYEGEQTGLYGTVETVSSDVISINAEGGEVHGQVVEVPARSVRKRFDVGEHVKVLGGKHVDVSGMVVEVKGGIVTLMSDQGEQEIKVFSKDLRKATDTTNLTASKGMYDVHDMVMLDSTTAAVVTKVEGGLLRVLDQNGTPKSVSPEQISLRRDNKRYAVASDSQGNDMKVGDSMKETEGEMRQGEVVNIFRSIFVFLYNREYTENHGAFVARAISLVSATPKSSINDLGKINPALNAQLPYGGASLRPPPSANINRNRLINTLVVVTKGTSKGLMGIIKDIQGETARVELKTNNKTLTIALTSLKRKDQKTGATYPLETGESAYGAPGRGPLSGQYDINPYGGSTVNPYGGSTVNPYGGATAIHPSMGGRTPGRNLAPGQYDINAYGGATGMHPAMGGQTPGNLGGRTPAPGLMGGRTPASAPMGGKTPAHNMGGWTPTGARFGQTPNPYGPR